MHPESRRRPRTASPRLEALETLVLLNGDLAVVPEAASTPEVVTSPAPDESTQSSADPGETGGDVILSVFTAEDQASDSSDSAADPAPPADEPPAEEAPAEEAVQTTSAPTDPPPDEEVSAAPPDEEVAPPSPVEEVPPVPPAEDVATSPVDPVDPLPTPTEPPAPPIVAPPAVESSPTAPLEAVPVSAPATPTPGPRIEVAPTAENLRIDLAVERTSNLAGKTIRFHTRETNIGTDPIRLTPLNDFDVVVEQNGAIVWKLSDVRRARAALLPSQAFEPLASRGVSVWWDGFRSRGGRLPVSGDVVVYSTMDGVDSPRQTIRIEPTPVNTPRPAPQPVRVEILPPTPPPPTPVLPPATNSTTAAPTTTASNPITPPVAPAEPVPAGSASTSPGESVAAPPNSIGSTAPVAGLTTTPTTPPATSASGSTTSTTSSTGGARTTTPVSPAEDPTDAATTGQPEVTTQVGGRRRWNTAIYGAVGQAWKQKRFQIPRPTTKPLTGVQHGIRQARLARAEALASRLR